MNIARKGMALVAVPLTFFCGVLAGEMWLVNSEEQLFLQEVRSRRVTALSSDVAALSLNCRSAIALFLLTHNKAYLIPLEKAKTQISEYLTALLDQCREDPIEAGHVASLDGLIQGFLMTCSQCLEIERNGGSSKSANEKLGQLSEFIHAINSRADAVRYRELYFMGGKPSELVLFRQKFQLVIIVSAVLAALLAWLIAYVFSRQIASRLITLSDNAKRLAKDVVLLEPLAGDDEISQVDGAIHRAADSLRTATSLLKAEEERLRRLINGMPVGVVLVTHDATIDFANVAAERLSSYKAADLTDQQLPRLFQFPTPMSEIPEVFEGYLFTKSGEKIPVDVRCQSIEIRGNIGHVIAFSDIRERREIERLRQEFVSMVTHDLRSPLHAISLVMQSLCYGLHGNIEKEARNALGEASISVKRMLSLVNELLVYETITSGNLQLTCGPFELHEAIQQAISEIRQLAEERQIVISVEQSDQIQLDSDRGKLIQVLVNLLSNAIKFSSDCETVMVRSGKKDVETVLIEVIDRGSGIPAEDTERIFDRYQQVRPDDANRGTGLGLSICRGIITAMEGDIGVESQFGKGSTFWLTLPVRRSAIPS